jgi:hypothetical protein
MNIDWKMVRARYEQQRSVPPLTGQSRLDVVGLDDEKICFKHQLWRDCLSKVALETAVTVLGDRPLPANAIEFAEELRSHYSNGPTVITECSRIPNLSAVVLKDLGYLQ